MYGCPHSPVYGSNGVGWAGSEDASSLEFYEHNVGHLATGSRWAELVKCSDLSFPGRLGGRAGGIKLPLVNGLYSCQEMRDACKGELRVAGFSSFTVFRVPGRKEEVF